MMKNYVSLKFASRSMAALSLALMMGCQSHHVPSVATVTSANDAEANLTQDEARTRQSLISDIAYITEIQLDAVKDTFHAKSAAKFQLSRAEGIFFDFENDAQKGAKFESIEVNGATAAISFAHHRLQIPANALHVGANSVTVTYTQNYSHDGRGLHRFVDPEDKNVYLYSQFETFDAHQMFPCFDQPDLKATMTMTVTAPKTWTVISTTRESKIKAVGENKVWSFPTTPKISTYLFSLHAGPYKMWHENAGSIPMRLFVRQALAKYAHPKDWFVPTRQGLAFYGKYFRYPYPFKKFDEIVAPDFNAGAMENVAAITFTENLIHRGPTTREERESTASVILHEMAHMWFGDLVTMKWWNGLWLNESFATFMSALSQANATEFKESWTTFYRHEKNWAYFQDQLVTTHPIEATIPDVATAFTNFDGITYGKGASVLKQLNFYLGEEKFRDGVRFYFTQHAYTNTTLADFIGALEHVSGKSLQGWSHTWLEEAGLDTIEPVFTCANGRIASFALKATGPDGVKTPREHRTRVRLFDLKDDALRAGAQADVIYHDGLTEISEFKGTSCPSFVDPNDDDFDYAKVNYDNVSLATIQNHAMTMPSAFARLRVWPTLKQMVRDRRLSPEVYLNVAANSLPLETDLQSAEVLVDALSQMLEYLPVSTSAQRAHRSEWVAKLENALWDRARRSPAGSDFQKVLLMNFKDIAESQTARDRINALLTGQDKWKGLNLDADRRWGMIVRLSGLDDPRAASLLEAERKQDTSEKGIQMALACEAARPTVAAKREWFEKFLNDANLKYARARTATRWMFPPTQDDLRASFAKDFYSQLPGLAKRREIDMVELFTQHFDPAVCTKESADELEKFTQAHADLPPTLIKQMRNDAQEDRRCALIRDDLLHR